MSTDDFEVSIVIPIYQEAEILREAIAGLFEGLEATFGAASGGSGRRYEVILAENGSRDDTVAIATEEAARRAGLSVFSYPTPNYGGALREGIFRARGTFVICEEIDICNVEFHRRAVELLRDDAAEMVVGSKAMRGADDRRPLARRVATRAYNGLLRVALGFRGTDTHGLKAFRRSVVEPVAQRCLVEHDVFASELVIRAQRDGLRVLEIPVAIEEKRPPSIDLARRVPRVAKNVARLAMAIHLGRDERSSAGAGPSDGPAQEPEDRD